jgi:hypothetical protein
MMTISVLSDLLPPPEAMVQFIPARPDIFNRGVLLKNSIQEPTEYNMHVNNNLYVEVGEEWMRWAMRCSIHALNIIMDGADPSVWPNPTNSTSSFGSLSAIIFVNWDISLTLDS